MTITWRWSMDISLIKGSLCNKKGVYFFD